MDGLLWNPKFMGIIHCKIRYFVIVQHKNKLYPEELTLILGSIAID